ncbi:hypothetical protein BV898_19583 [Hypsibius exemplaris]|uniref:Uncharacterized protein n=1 Tax=Hypsibius exemplaris TaxID=2072580 RepID=A0A9X6NJH3_HYPEX|nr:hypothetical protein BV898_19583 [Hypsibius exemplaris]
MEAAVTQEARFTRDVPGAQNSALDTLHTYKTHLGSPSQIACNCSATGNEMKHRRGGNKKRARPWLQDYGSYDPNHLSWFGDTAPPPARWCVGQWTLSGIL